MLGMTDVGGRISWGSKCWSVAYVGMAYAGVPYSGAWHMHVTTGALEPRGWYLPDTDAPGAIVTGGCEIHRQRDSYPLEQ